MKSVVKFSALALALALPAALAQDITSLPQCAQQPILLAISSSGCPLTDIACICRNDDFVNGLIDLIPTLCNPDEVAVTSEFAVTLCGAYDVNIDIPPELLGSAAASSSEVPATSSAASSSGPSSAPASESSAATSSAAPTSATSGSSSGSASAATTSAATSTSSAAPESAASSATSSGPAQQTGNAATANTVGLTGLMGAMAVGLVAAL